MFLNHVNILLTFPTSHNATNHQTLNEAWCDYQLPLASGEWVHSNTPSLECSTLAACIPARDDGIS